MTDTWQVPEPTLTADDIVVAEAADRLTASFSIADHLSDIDKATLLEFAKRIV